MPTHTRKSRNAETDGDDYHPTLMFVVLSQERRQHAIAYLAQKTAAISIGDLAEYIALKEGDPTYDRYERVLTDLHHCQLPYMVDAGVVRYDPDTELIELLVDRDDLTPYLRLIESEGVS